jgi:methylated-DNA-[protein]-cysteine S-methyltransferase
VGVVVFDTAIGLCGLAWRDHGVNSVVIHERSVESATARLVTESDDATAVDEAMPDQIAVVMQRITAHLGGELDPLRDIEIDLGEIGGFRRDVYDVARSVDPGDTITYGEIATRLGNPNASREVGQAMGSNPVPLIVPCHRVLAAGGKLGGFSAPGGINTKLKLLVIEGAAYQGQPTLF